jgi:hypothetical protein
MIIPPGSIQPDLDFAYHFIRRTTRRSCCCLTKEKAPEGLSVSTRSLNQEVTASGSRSVHPSAPACS